MGDSSNDIGERIGNRFAPGGCCFCALLIGQSYLLFLLLWTTTALCLVYPALWASVLLACARTCYPSRQKLMPTMFVLLAYAPIAAMFMWRWYHCDSLNQWRAVF
jgi:hypothetical protein